MPNSIKHHQTPSNTIKRFHNTTSYHTRPFPLQQCKCPPILSLNPLTSLLLLLFSQLLILSPFNSLSVFINRCCTHSLYLPSHLTLSQFNKSVNVHLICSLTSCSLTSSCSKDERISFSSMMAGREERRLIMRGRMRVEVLPVEDVDEMLLRWWCRWVGIVGGR